MLASAVSRPAGLIVTALILAVTAPSPPLPAQPDRPLEASHVLRLARLQPGIDRAIDKAVAWLLERQHSDGSWGFHQRRFPGGQTALSVYTLLKAGVPTSHAAVQRGLAFVRGSEQTMVYSVATQLLALAENGDPSDLEAIEERAAALLTWQSRGSWDYPNRDSSIREFHSAQDLSLTQFALLGLRAAQAVGVDVPRRRWRAALDGVDAYQTPLRVVDDLQTAGFSYRMHGNKATGSMTTAGITALKIAADHSDKLPKARQRSIDRMIQQALAWLQKSYAVDKNPGGENQNLYYYLYGLERAAGLLGLNYIGTRPWYLDGAKFLVDKQRDDGSWTGRNAECDTCFAVLFLKRVNAPVTGKASRKRPVTIAEDETVALGLRGLGGTGGWPLDLWITRIDTPGKQTTWHVEQVEYLVGDAVVATVESNPAQPWKDEGLHARYEFNRNGTHRVSARAYLLRPVDGAAEPERKVIHNPGFVLEADHVLEPWMLSAADAATHNRMSPEWVAVVRASSQADGHMAQAAVDGLAATAWRCAADDPAPTLRIDLRRALKAQALTLLQATTQRAARGRIDHITRIALRVNKRKPIEIDLTPGEMQPTRIEFGKLTAIRQLHIQVLARRPGTQIPGMAGIAEICFLR